jgi:hypothetical protein
MQEKSSEDCIRKIYKYAIMYLLDNLNERGMLKMMQKILEIIENSQCKMEEEMK